ncbi:MULTISPECIES: helix-turn-helix domain-containing protein [Chryseobacterium]|uniref:helix-turn-helix domain-containing protein n=1 Tax=Chryseobacterium TaxID=59732 RepID=UPI001295305B|nr:MULTISPECIES: helix-turn-helix domain-containing protein [Chryseobacterium]MDR6923708.1 hypothetical protein [Chryseobacterium sp. 2987]
MKKYRQPNFKQIYTDILFKKYPEKYNACEGLLLKKELLALDVMKINTLIFGISEKNSQRYRSYKESDIICMLEYQKKNKLNNTQLAVHFKLSRNTVAKWKKIFLYNTEV